MFRNSVLLHSTSSVISRSETYTLPEAVHYLPWVQLKSLAVLGCKMPCGRTHGLCWMLFIIWLLLSFFVIDFHVFLGMQRALFKAQYDYTESLFTKPALGWVGTKAPLITSLCIQSLIPLIERNSPTLSQRGVWVSFDCFDFAVLVDFFKLSKYSRGKSSLWLICTER